MEASCNALGDVAKDAVEVVLEGAKQTIQAAKDAINSLISAALKGLAIADGLANIFSIHSFSVSGSIDATTTSFSFAAALDMTFLGQRFTPSLTINMKDVAGELWSYLKGQFSGLSTLYSDCLAKYTEVANDAADALNDAYEIVETAVNDVAAAALALVEEAAAAAIAATEAALSDLTGFDENKVWCTAWTTGGYCCTGTDNRFGSKDNACASTTLKDSRMVRKIVGNCKGLGGFYCCDTKKDKVECA